jgi:RNA polymerase sigma-70 factor (ECF subfamily)
MDAKSSASRGRIASAGTDRCDGDDSALVERVKANDSAAFDVLVGKYRGRIFSVLYNMTSNRDDAFDLTQEVFIKAYRAMGRFNGKSALYTWLYRIAVNSAISHINRNRLRRFFSLESIDGDCVRTSCRDILADVDDAKRAVFLKELQENLNVALQKLSNKHRTVVVLCEIEGLQSAEVASILKCSEGTVRSRLHYAKEQLKSFLRRYL